MDVCKTTNLECIYCNPVCEHRKIIKKESRNMLCINDFVKEVGENAKNHGWWDGEERSFGELIALVHSELSEALEEYRENVPGKKLNRDPFSTYYSGGGYVSTSPSEGCDKPEGIPSELADVVIRVFDMCHHYKIDIEKMLIEKHEFNKSRPFRHGGKTI